MTDILRRDFLKSSAALSGAAALGLGSFGPADAQALRKVRYLTPFGFIYSFAEVLYAKTGGFYVKEGLDVEVEGGRGSAMAVQQITAGNALISRTGGTDLIKAYAKTPTIIAVGECYHKDIFYVISNSDKPIKGPADMAGKTIGIVSNGGATENLLDMMLVSKDVPIADVKREVVGNAPGAFEMVKLGRIQAFIATADTLLALQLDKQPAFGFSCDDFAPSPGQVYVVAKTAMEPQRELIAKFMRGSYAAIGDMIAKKKDLTPVITSMTSQFELSEAKRPDKGLAILASGVDTVLEPVYADKMASKPEVWKVAYDLMIKAKIITPIDDRNFYDDSARKLAFG